MTTESRILDLIHESVITRDPAGIILSWNAASEALYGWPKTTAIGCQIDDLLQSRFAAAAPDRDLMAPPADWEGELIRVTANGTELVLDVRWQAERDATGAVLRIVETARDITERKAIDDALRLSEYRYRNMFEAMAVAFWEVDFTQVGAMLIPLRDQGVTDLRTWLLANRDFVRRTMERAIVLDLNLNGFALFGADTRDAIIGRAIADFWPPASEPVYIDSLVATMTRQPHIVSETRLNRVDGEPIDVLFTVSLSENNRKRGVMLIGVVDISARKQAEAALQRLQAEFAHAARVSVLGELTASLAHEVNQPLAAIATSASASMRWLAAEQPDLDEVRSLSARIVSDARRAAAIINRVRAMAERRETERQYLPLNQLVAEAVAFLDHDLAMRAVTLETRLASELPPVLVDRTQLHQIVVNLVVNAAQAMADSPTRHLCITTSLAEGAVVLAVEDSGPGLPAHPEQLFESFFTTKSSGMGMGLAICRSLIEAHGGQIVAANGAVGARFIVTLPITPRS
ncbi:PAS domain-containing sensor histidine kinase [Sandarakinorhabdus oryzae]|uniref:PAS domain-containing sensor histidine kinase n=1 Tax=Sandarakinorhabdus oryzae TaxID=2675220 RepID=UPI0012E29B41|nr:ATP-binding protein [Sandarakinorhabdus oryzae]